MTRQNPFRLDGKYAVVTGANRGLGLAFARGLASAGARVGLLVRDGEGGASVREEIAAAGGAADVFIADVTDQPQVRRVADEVAALSGGPDVLVCNAGACIHAPAFDVGEADWRSIIDVNLTGVWNCCQAFGRRMVEAGHGSIVNIGSMSGFIVNRPQWQPAYNASKAAVHHLTRSLAAEWAVHNVRVNAIAPGYVETEMTPAHRPEFRQNWILDAPMQRCAQPDEIVPGVLFLASSASSFVTGSVLVMDGGYSVF
jgi:NAD(P)-dependent dehydrogenase (short-subunit alcohol dehydrogenase family)